MKDIEKEKLEARKEEIVKRQKELDEQFTKVQNWIASARNEYTTNLGRIDEIDKFIKAIDEKNKEAENKIKSKKELSK